MTREHVVPISKGGARAWYNVVLAHQKCNGDRATRDLEPSELAAANAIWSTVFGDIEIEKARVARSRDPGRTCKLGPEALLRAEPILHAPLRGWRERLGAPPTLADVWPSDARPR